MTLKELIAACLAAKTGDKQFALFGDDAGWWRAEIGNEGMPVMLGESEGEFRAEGTTPEEAVAELLRRIQKGTRHR